MFSIGMRYKQSLTSPGAQYTCNANILLSLTSLIMPDDIQEPKIISSHRDALHFIVAKPIRQNTHRIDPKHCARGSSPDEPWTPWLEVISHMNICFSETWMAFPVALACYSHLLDTICPLLPAELVQLQSLGYLLGFGTSR